jgi:hypothetical protein
MDTALRITSLNTSRYFSIATKGNNARRDSCISDITIYNECNEFYEREKTMI